MGRRRRSGVRGPAVVLLLICLLAGGDVQSSVRMPLPLPAGDSERAAVLLVDPKYKYGPPIEVTTVRALDRNFLFNEGDSIDGNIWTRIFESSYGIRVKNIWKADALQFDRKLDISIAAGDLPDYFLVNNEQLKRLYEAGQLAELSDLLETYGSPYLKRLLRQDGGVSLGAASFDGKLVGIPRMMVNGGVSTAEVLWVRMDWLEKLGLAEPRTIDDVAAIAGAFAGQDPDGNGMADTIGLGVNNELFLYHGSLKGFFNGFGAYPGIWLPSESGRLEYGSIQPEARQALARLADMYGQGMLDKEFAVKRWTELAEAIVAGRVGLSYGSVSDGGSLLWESMRLDPEARWKSIPIVSVSGKPADPQLLDPASNFYVVRKDSAHPEVAVKLANIYLWHYYEKDYGEEPNPFITTPSGIYPGKYPPVTIDPLHINLVAYRELQEALRMGDGRQLGFPANVHYNRLRRYANGDQEMGFANAIFGSAGSFRVIDGYDLSGLGRYDAFQGAATPTMVEKLAALERMQDETFTRIIMGEIPLSEFDRFVGDWLHLGGEQITKEVNEWYDKQGKREGGQ